MGYLDDYINNATKPRKRPRLKSIPKVIALIRSGEFDPSDPRHVRMRNVAIKYGYVDEDGNVLKGA